MNLLRDGTCSAAGCTTIPMTPPAALAGAPWICAAHAAADTEGSIQDGYGLPEIDRWWEWAQGNDLALPLSAEAQVSLRAFFARAQRVGLIAHNPTTDLHDLPIEDGAPHSLPPVAVEWLVRAASAQKDATARLRDLALIPRLSECGLRSQEAADVQLRDLDLDGAMLTVEAVRRMREHLTVRCPGGLPPIGSEAEREPLLMKHNMTKADVPWEPGLTPNAMHKHLTELGRVAAGRIQGQAGRSRVWSE